MLEFHHLEDPQHTVISGFDGSILSQNSIDFGLYYR